MVAPQILSQRIEFRLTELRWAGAAMLVAGAAWPTGQANFGIPCPLRTLTGIPCPFCGMTTSVVAVMHGHFANALTANPFGFLAVAVAVYLLLRRRDKQWFIPLMVLVAGVLSSWVYQLHRFEWL